MAIPSDVQSLLDTYSTNVDSATSGFNDYKSKYDAIMAGSESDNPLEKLTTLKSDYDNWRDGVNTTNSDSRKAAQAAIDAIEDPAVKAEAQASLDAIYSRLKDAAAQSPAFKNNLSQSIKDAQDMQNEKKDKQESASTPSDGENKESDDKTANDGGDSEVKAKNVTANSSSGGVSAPTKRQYNPLSKYSSSAYRISFYMLTPDSIDNYLKSKKWDLPSMTLICQDGGVTPGVDKPRNKFFPYDMYIDNLDISTVISTQAQGTSSTSFEFKFDIYEPYGISFPTNLIRAAVDLQQQANSDRKISHPIEALNIHYVIALHFYGYDKEGNIMPGQGPGGAAFERIFPIHINTMNMRLDSKITVYSVTATTLSEFVAYGGKSGVVTDNSNKNADTVKAALNALASVINERQKSISKPSPNAKQDIPDEYVFEIDPDSGIADATIVDKDHYVVGSAPAASVGNSEEVNVRLSEGGKTQSVAKLNKNIQIAAGTPILKAIDTIITQSSFIGGAMKNIDKEQVDKVKKTEQGYDTNANPAPLYWYHVTPKVENKGWDKARKDYAYKITYMIQKKEIPHVRSTAVDSTTLYKGAYKRYEYYYTGKNSEVIKYEQNFNNLYYNVGTLFSEAANANTKDPAPNKALPSSDADASGRLPGSFEAVNTVKSFLYSPYDESLNATIQILGDPDYLITSETGNSSTVFGKWYGEDYTINPGTSQVFIEINFKQTTDYDTETGLLTTDDSIYFWNYPQSVKNAMSGDKNGIIYMVNSIKSKFVKGMFTQEIKSTLPPFASVTDATADGAKREGAGAKPAENQPSNVNSGAGRGSAKTYSEVQAGPGRGTTGKAVWGKGGPPKKADKPDSPQDDDNSKKAEPAKNTDSGREESGVMSNLKRFFSNQGARGRGNYGK